MSHAELAQMLARALTCVATLRREDVASESALRPDFVLGFSGGADSCALAWLLGHLLPDYYAQHQAPLPWAGLRLVHVAHGLGAHAAPMQGFCETFAADWNLPLTVMPVQVEQRPRTSLEAAARSARYQALEQSLGAGDCLLTAHHADDQAETVLLNLLRGSGPSGLAAMVRARPFGPGWLLRPLLEVRGETLRALLREEGIDWFEDPTNAETAPTRNFLRQDILPRLEARMPGVVSTLGRVASLQGAYADFVDQAAAAELAATTAVIAPTRFRIEALDTVAPLLGRVMLRRWLKPILGQFPREADLNRIEDMMHTTAAQQAPELALGDCRLRCFQGVLYALSGPVPLLPDSTWTLALAPKNAVAKAKASMLENTLVLPHGVLRMAPVVPRDESFSTGTAGPLQGDATSAGTRAQQEQQEQQKLRPEGTRAESPAYPTVCLRADVLASAGLTVALRQGGERLRCAAGHTRAVKDLLREAGLPPWQRAVWPLVFVDGLLAAVPSIAVDPRFAPPTCGASKVSAVTLAWTPEDVWTERRPDDYFSGNNGSGKS